MRRPSAVPGILLVAGLLLSGLAGGSALAAGSGAGGVQHATPAATQFGGVQVDPDDVLLRVALDANGTGHWRVEYRIRLDDENATEAFERHREEIESNPGAYRERFATDMRATIATAENATGREMALANVTVAASRERLPQRYGVITYTFDWHGFATANATAIEAGDALRGLFLDRETTLIVTWPRGFHRVAVAPAPHDARTRAVVWEGPVHFAGDEPHVLLSTRAAPGTGSPGGTDGSGGPAGQPLSRRGDGVLRWVLLGLLGVGVAGFGYAARRGLVDLSVGREEREPGATADSAPDLMSNEEQVRTLLADHGGRLKQQEVAAELDWTDAKTSKVIRGMREDGTVETFRLGRENVVTLPDTDPAEGNT